MVTSVYNSREFVIFWRARIVDRKTGILVR